MVHQIEKLQLPSDERGDGAYLPNREWLDLRWAANSLSASIPPELKWDCARAFSAEAIASYWFHLENRPKSSLRDAPSPSYELGREGETLATRLGKAAARMSVEDASFAIGSTYAMMLPDKVRSKNGVFYTPPPLVDFMLGRAQAAGVNWSTARVLDPACGGGAFLSPILRRLARHLASTRRQLVFRRIEESLHGIEIDSFSAWLSLVFFDVTMHEELGISDAKLNPVRVCDALECKTEHSRYDLVIANPPYGRIKLAKAERERYSRSLFGHANLYGLFLDLAVHLTSSKGVVAFVAPTSFLCGEYFKRLRELLANEAPPSEFNLLSHRTGVFENVLQEALVAVFKKGAQRGAWVDVNFISLEKDQVETAGKARSRLPFSPGQPWIIPRSKSETSLVKRLEGMPHRLSDWGYKVSTGPLVWNRLKDRLRQRSSGQTVPLIWAEAVTASGTFAFRANRRNHAPYFAKRSDDDPVLVRQPCVLLQRTTSREQPRRLIAAELPLDFLEEHGAVAIENHLNMLIPIVSSPKVDPGTLTAFLNSEIADRVFRCISGTVAVSAYELEAMPLPSPVHLGDGLPKDISELYKGR